MHIPQNNELTTNGLRPILTRVDQRTSCEPGKAILDTVTETGNKVMECLLTASVEADGRRVEL